MSWRDLGPEQLERQFNPHDPAFVPRAFSITHVNLTHRNWTAVGQPDCDWLPVVDPRGLVTPLLDGWSLDAWVVPARGEPLLPSRAEDAEQRLLMNGTLAVETRARQDGATLESVADVVWEGRQPCCRLRLRGSAREGGWRRVVCAFQPHRHTRVRDLWADFAHAFVDEDETGMINAVLDQLARQLRAGEFGTGA